VYTSDPNKNKNAKQLKKVSVTKLMRILSKGDITAGAYDLMDPLALRIIQRSKIPTVILNGKTPRNVLRALESEHVGTYLVHR
jgi:uridylate kinase